MHVLVVPYNYPTKESPSNAIFIREQVLALRRQIQRVGVLGAIPKTISKCVLTKDFAFGKPDENEWVVQAPAIRGMLSLNRIVACCLGKALFEKYIQINGKPDLIHVHNVQAADLAIWIKNKYNIPFVITEHSSLMWQIGGKRPSHLKKLQSIYELSSANIAVSKALADHLTAVFDLPFIYIPNVVDTDYFQLNSSRLSNNLMRFASIGNLTDNKNHIALVKAVHTLVDRGYPIKLDIGGGGENMRHMKEYICVNKLQDRVQMLGPLIKSQVKELLGQSDFFVLPSLKETFGVVIIEAMSCGLPVLAFKAGGPESIITSDTTGILLDPRDDLVNGLIQLMSTSYDSQKIRLHAEKNFSYIAVAEELLNQYSAVTK